MRRFLFVGVPIMLIGAAAVSIVLMQGFASEQKDFATSRRLLKKGYPEAAYHHLTSQRPSEDPKGKWGHLEISILEQLGQGGALAGCDRQLLRSRPIAQILACGALLRSGDGEGYSELRAFFGGRGPLWLNLDADALVMEGKQEEAIALLNSESFDGGDDTGRLIRLALLVLPGDVVAAWDHLSLALEKDPRNGDLHTLRAQVLEAFGQSSPACQEYVAALCVEPSSLLRRNELAEFYRREGNYTQALDTWIEGEVIDATWVKVLFWSRVASPRKLEGAPPAGPCYPLATYLHSLREGKFWSREGAPLADQRQETYWLQLLQLLKDGEGERALTFIEGRSYGSESWVPELERNIYNELVSNGLSNRIAVLFAAAGWKEAALQLWKEGESVGDEGAFVLAQALRDNRGIEEALSFVRGKGGLALLSAELEIASGETDRGLALLEEIVKEGGEGAPGAAWLLALGEIDAGRYNSARQIVEDESRLKNSLSGQEMLARIAFFSGELAEADLLYEEIAHRSAEAKAYLSKRALVQRDWRRARQLTGELVCQFPDELELRREMRELNRHY